MNCFELFFSADLGCAAFGERDAIRLRRGNAAEAFWRRRGNRRWCYSQCTVARSLLLTDTRWNLLHNRSWGPQFVSFDKRMVTMIITMYCDFYVLSKCFMQSSVGIKIVWVLVIRNREEICISSISSQFGNCVFFAKFCVGYLHM